MIIEGVCDCCHGSVPLYEDIMLVHCFILFVEELSR
jgi:hypothetical protein